MSELCDSKYFLSLKSYGDTWGKIQRALAIWSGFGMTLTGVQTCGDYMFSGHTVVITMLNFFVTECKLFFGLLWLSCFLRIREAKTLINVSPVSVVGAVNEISRLCQISSAPSQIICQALSSVSSSVLTKTRRTEHMNSLYSLYTDYKL